jgi:3-deoxy-D-manno-octulosonic-acid transferase
MALSLGRLARFAVGATAPVPPDGAPDRPTGDLVWLHAPSAVAARGLFGLARNLSQDELCAVLLTCGQPLELAEHLRDLDPPVLVQPPPPDRQAEVEGFLAHWKPQAVVLSDGELPSAVLAEAAAHKLPVLMVNSGPPRMLGGMDWLPGVMRRALTGISRAFVSDEAAGRAYRRAGLDRVQTGRLEERPPTPPASETEREAMARLLAARPVWLALCPSADEEPAVIAAHRAALERSHRLLMILLVADPARADALHTRLSDEFGWRVARRDRDEDPDPETEVLLFAGLDEIGLALRLAPICFLGGSLAGPGCNRNPIEAAALGSAIIHGPRVGSHGPEIARLGAARGAVAVANDAQLAEAVIELQAPDQAARLAAAAWGVATDGAEVMAEVIDELRRMIDAAGEAPR